MEIKMPSLPYAPNALEPIISERTIEFHHGKHLQTYVNTLISLTKGTEHEGRSVEEIIKSTSDGPIFNNAGQILNHTLYFAQFRKATTGNKPSGRLLQLINESFGNFDEFKTQLNQAAITLFGSGWAWLSQTADNKLVISKEFNANTPLKNGHNPLLCFDVWEHAYYIDYQNRRADHINDLWNIINWDEVASRLK